MTPQEDILGLIPLLTKDKKIVITTHHKPDGDAIGSSLGLYHYLKAKGLDAIVVVPSDYPQFLEWMPGSNSIIQYSDNNVDIVTKTIHQADILFCLDFNALNRINALEKIVESSSATKVMIDHHINPSGFDDFRFWDTNVPATAQLIFEFITEVLKDIDSISPDIATCLYAGIVSDTGCFKFPSTTPKTHEIGGFLMQKGANHSAIHQQLFENQKENSLRFMGYCISEKMKIIPELHTAVICISKAELDKFSIGTGDTDAIVNVALSMREIKLSIFVVERPDMVKLSMRSKNDVPANEICSEYFMGGGHKNAAGGKSDLDIKATEEKIYSVLPKFAPYLRD